MNNLFAISGKSKSGKDTVGEIIQYLLCGDHYNSFKQFTERYPKYGICVYQLKKFAGKTTEAFKSITGIDYHLIKNKEEVRPLYKKFAQGQKKIFGEDVWVKALFNDYKSAGEKCGFTSYSTRDIREGFKDKPSWVITDLRFPNELKAVRDRNGICIRVNRPNEIIAKHQVFHEEGNYAVASITTPIGIEHISETALDSYKDWDYVIDNDSDIASLVEKIEIMLQHFKIIE